MSKCWCGVCRKIVSLNRLQFDMPRYIYKCDDCSIVFQVVHSIKEKLTDCEECDSEQSLKRIPSMPVVLKQTGGQQKQKTGSLVKQYIEDAKDDLEQEKKELRSQTYDD